MTAAHTDGAPSRFSDNITNKKQLHARILIRTPGKTRKEYAKDRKAGEVSGGDAVTAKRKMISHNEPTIVSVRV